MLSSLLVTTLVPPAAYAETCAADKLCRPGQNGDGTKEGETDDTDDEPGPEDEENEECKSCGE